jgi:hypothetical protein
MSGAEADGTVVPRTSWRGNAGLGKVAMTARTGCLTAPPATRAKAPSDR